jgi:hypothetical protein
MSKYVVWFSDLGSGDVSKVDGGFMMRNFISRHDFCFIIGGAWEKLLAGTIRRSLPKSP